jgi:hypothetical protein
VTGVQMLFRSFVLAICDPIVKKNIIEKYKESVLDFKIDKTGVTTIY